MQKPNFEQIVAHIVKQDTRYQPKAYDFVREGLNYTLKNIKRNGSNSSNHVSGPELLDGLRDFTLKEFGPMGKTVLNDWGIMACRDFGHIVFHLVSHGVFGKSDTDSLDDFNDLWTFEEAFVHPFLPQPPKASKAAIRRMGSVKRSKKNVAASE